MWYKFLHDWDHTNYLVPTNLEEDFYKHREIVVDWWYTVADCHEFDEKWWKYETEPHEIIIKDYIIW